MAKDTQLPPLPSSNPKLRARADSLHREQWVPTPIDQVFPFFADAQNLQALTPPWLSFRILTEQVEMRRGARIEYRLRLHGIPLSWLTVITDWEPGVRFVDEQLSGPYRLWRHEHRFESRDGGTLLTDHVEYCAPGGPLTPIVHRLFVRPDLERIFEYRRKIVAERFGSAKSA